MQDQDAVAVIRELRVFRDDIDEIMNAIGEKRSLPRDEIDRLQALFKDLKARLKAGAKRKSENRFESAYYNAAVRHAAANLLVATNTHPIKSKWFSALYNIRIDITYYLHQLETQFPDS